MRDTLIDPPDSLKPDHINLFYKRARSHLRISYTIFGLILLLFAASAFIFLFAQNLDSSKGSLELFQEVMAAKAGQAEIIKVAEAVLNGTKVEMKAGQRTTFDLLQALEFLGDAKTRKRVIEEKEQLMLKTGYFTAVDDVKSREELSAQRKGLGDLEEAFNETLKEAQDRFLVGEVTRTDVEQVNRFIADTKLKEAIADQRINVAQLGN